jgi:hypothetical protein
MVETGLSGSDWISLTALVVAAGSAAFTWVSTRQAKRQADAVLGDVSPTFGVYQVENVEYSSQALINIEVVNHNRRPLLIHEFSFQYPESAIVFADYESLDGVIRSIIKAVSDNPKGHKWEVPQRLKGCGMNSEPHTLTLPYRCGWKVDTERQPFRFGFSVEYSQEGQAERHQAYGSLDVMPPTE